MKLPAPPPAKKRIFCVEDHEDTGWALIATLELAGYEVTLARSLAEALKLAKSAHFDLYILDNLLPDGTGVEVCQHIRSFDPHTSILFLSGAAYKADREKAIRAGAQEYLTKPEGLEVLEPTIARLIGEAKLLTERAVDEFPPPDCGSIKKLCDQAQRPPSTQGCGK